MISPDDVRQAIAAHGATVVALIETATGSTPRDAGCAMLIHRNGLSGSIGGGALEYAVVTRARAMIARRTEDVEIIDQPLGPEIDQCCGGHVRIVLKRFDAETDGLEAAALSLGPGGPNLTGHAPDRPVIVYGAGHVGRALATALAPLPFAVTLTDSRAEMTAPDVVASPLPEAIATDAPATAFHLVMTHSHALDLEIVATVLQRPHRFCGLIGSATKRAVFTRRLVERGLSEDQISALTCPIGEPGLHDKRPAVIAAATAVQLLQRDAVLATPIGNASTATQA